MKFFKWMKDGGPESTVWGFWFVEIKGLFSIALLNFRGDSREAYHSHAFDSWSWLLHGELTEDIIEALKPGYNVVCGRTVTYKPSFKPIWIPRTRLHQVDSKGESWVLTFRGPWAPVWYEWLPMECKLQILTHGRRIIGNAIDGQAIQATAARP